jgi:hypothetical protein
MFGEAKMAFRMRGLACWLAVAWSTPLQASDAQIREIVNAISPARIESTIRKLAGFGTRHTLSDTKSETRGIGAARQWIRAELERCSKDADGRLQVAFDEFVQSPGPRIPKATSIVNVVATLPGTQTPARERIYVVSGHYDSRASDVMDATSDAPGANDDASGTAAVIEMACVMAKHRFDATLVFMAVAGEEQGLAGATHWAERARRQNLDIAGMITNDIVGSSTGEDGRRDDRSVRLFANGLAPLLSQVIAAARGTSDDTERWRAQMRTDLESIARAGGEADTPTHQLGRHLKTTGERHVPGFVINVVPRPDRYLRGGDHLPFLNRGYAAVRFTEPNEDYRRQHQDVRVEGGVQYGDLPQFVDFAYVAQVARINAAGLASLALALAPPKEVFIEVTALTNDSTLRWAANAEPDLAGYRIVWREASAALWQHAQDVGNVTRHTVRGVSKDHFIFGVQSVDHDGNASPAVFPKPWRP